MNKQLLLNSKEATKQKNTEITMSRPPASLKTCALDQTCMMSPAAFDDWTGLNRKAASTAMAVACRLLANSSQLWLQLEQGACARLVDSSRPKPNKPP